MRSPPSSPIAYAGTPWTLQCLPSHDACNDGGAIRGTCLRRSRVGKGLHCLRRLRSMVPVSTQPPWTSSARLRPQASARSLRPHALQEGSKGVRGSRGDLNLMPPSPQQVRYRSFSPCPATEWKSAALSASMHAPPCCPPVGSDGRCSHAMVEFAHRSESPMESSASSQRGRTLCSLCFPFLFLVSLSLGYF